MQTLTKPLWNRNTIVPREMVKGLRLWPEENTSDSGVGGEDAEQCMLDQGSDPDLSILPTHPQHPHPFLFCLQINLLSSPASQDSSSLVFPASLIHSFAHPSVIRILSQAPQYLHPSSPGPS